MFPVLSMKKTNHFLYYKHVFNFFISCPLNGSKITFLKRNERSTVKVFKKREKMEYVFIS